MPYATTDRISHDPIVGGIEITEAQYAEAMAAMLAGKQVLTEHGYLEYRDPQPVDPPPAENSHTVDDVWAEKDRRWALGFDYTFPDERGTHHIATAPKDMVDWNKVSLAAQAAISLGAPDTPLGIYTATSGATKVMVTAMEWQQIILAAAAFFQLAMDCAAALIANPEDIPEDFRDDKYWTVT